MSEQIKYEAVFGEKLINEISKFLEYKKESGSFVWVNPTSNRVSVGMIAGNSHKQSYTTIYINGHMYYAQDLVWLMETGSLPHGIIDHINLDKKDNRFSNLRLCNRSENGCNRGLNKNNTSGEKGVTWHKRASKWCGEVWKDGEKHYLGLFIEYADAVNAVRRKRIELHGDFAKFN